MTKTQVEIRQADDSDLDELTELFDAYRVFYEKPSDKDGARHFLRERLAEADSVIYIARGEVEGRTEPLGFTQLYPSHSSVSMKRLWILNDLFVVPGARNLGVGRALIDRARQLAVDTGAKGLILETAADNATAKALYDSYGFVKDTEFDRYALDV